MILLFFGKKDKNLTPLKEMSKFHGKRIKYAVEKLADGEIVLGKKGGITVKNGEIIVVCDAHEIFRCKQKGAIIAELMSNDGVTIKAFDHNEQRERLIIAYYEYYH